MRNTNSNVDEACLRSDWLGIIYRARKILTSVNEIVEMTKALKGMCTRMGDQKDANFFYPNKAIWHVPNRELVIFGVHQIGLTW